MSWNRKMIEKDKNPSLNTSKKFTETQQPNHNLKPMETLSDREELKRVYPFGSTQGWNYGIPGWYLERY